MELESVIDEINYSYKKWCKKGGITPKESDYAALRDVIRDSLLKTNEEHVPGSLTLEGKDSKRKTKLKFYETRKCLGIQAFGQTYYVEYSELEKISAKSIKYEDDHMESLWTRTVHVAPESEDFIKNIYKKTCNDNRKRKP